MRIDMGVDTCVEGICRHMYGHVCGHVHRRAHRRAFHLAIFNATRKSPAYGHMDGHSHTYLHVFTRAPPSAKFNRGERCILFYIVLSCLIVSVFGRDGRLGAPM